MSSRIDLHRCGSFFPSSGIDARLVAAMTQSRGEKETDRAVANHFRIVK
jgi:hypothetical protein